MARCVVCDKYVSKRIACPSCELMICKECVDPDAEATGCVHESERDLRLDRDSEMRRVTRNYVNG